MVTKIGLMAAFGCLATTASGQRPESTVVFTNVNVVPMDRQRVLERQTVIVERGQITYLGPAPNVLAPRGARFVDGTGKYLMPGLVDAHVHLASSPEDEQRTILKMFVANGVTTVLNMRGAPQILELRAAVASGRTLGPRIYTVGPYINEPFVTTADQVERAVVEQKRAGYDFVKLHGDLSREAYARLNTVARREGIRVIGHAPRNLGVAAMFEERQYAVAHGEEFVYDRNNRSRPVADIEPELPGLASSMKATGIWLMPNLTAFHNIALMVHDLDAMLARPEMRYLPVSNQVGWGPATNPYTRRMSRDRYPHIMALHGVIQKLTRTFSDSGVALLLGTDAMNTGTIPGFSAHDELDELVTAGLTAFEALRTATANAAAFLGEADRRGMVAVGQAADLVLLDANPLQNIANSRRIAGVMLHGRWLTSADISRLLVKQSGTDAR